MPNPQYIYNCLHCKTEVRVSYTRGLRGPLYCSLKCRTAYNTLDIACGYCKKVFTIHKCEAAIKKYCSRKCSFDAIRITDEERRLYKAEWARRNPQKPRDPQISKEYRDKYYAFNADKLRKRSRDWHSSNREVASARSKRYRDNHKEELKIKRDAYFEANKDELNKRRRWRFQNDAAYRKRKQSAAKAGKARRKGADGSFTNQDIEALYIQQNGKCEGCRRKLDNFQIDHIVPISKGGTNWPSNLQLLCQQCNRAKGAMDPTDWSAKRGRLF